MTSVKDDADADCLERNLSKVYGGNKEATGSCVRMVYETDKRRLARRDEKRVSVLF